jgi:hypothetical protein
MPNSRLYFGNGAAPVPGSEVSFALITLDAGMVASKLITLPSTPFSTSEISAWVVNGSTFVYGVDFTIEGDVVNYSISSYAGVLAVGNAIQFIYKRV